MKLPPRPRALLLMTALMASCLLPLEAQQGGTDATRMLAASILAEDEERDAKEIAERVTAAVTLRQEVIITLLNGHAVLVTGRHRTTAQRYWLIVADSDGGEFRFRASLVATIKIK